MDKLCYIDQGANAATYINMMMALEAACPGTVFVYMTMPLMTSEDSNNVLRNQYNAAVRSHCAANNRLLYDLADMEAHDPAGVPYTFTYGGQTYQKLYSGYTSDGGHLNTTGRQRIAMGWYAVAAQLVPAAKPADFDQDGDVDLEDFAAFQACFNGPNAPPAVGCSVPADLDGDGDVDLVDFSRFQACFNGPNAPPACP